MKDGLRACSRICMDNKKECPDKECRMWIDYPDEYNCCLISIHENGCMTLREIGERLHISFARVKQIESDALKKIRKREGVRE
jgi:hypothetical protein